MAWLFLKWNNGSGKNRDKKNMEELINGYNG